MASGDYVNLPLDRATTVEGVEAGCTGIGQTKDDPHWRTFSVRIEFADAESHYLGGGRVTVSKKSGQQLLSVRCDAPWILLNLPKGDYVVEGQPVGTHAKPRTTSFHAPARGQMRLVLQFPDA
jgi:hypothetical protein